jgi:mono/diheme cytochrome c family protein
MRRLFICFALLGMGSGTISHAAQPAHPLVWDSVDQRVEAAPGATLADFTFAVTNTADTATEITEVRASCGCTVVKLPAMPWVLAPGASGSFAAQVDFRGKSGKFTKSLFVSSAAGVQVLQVTVAIPEAPEDRRARNQQMAIADRQAVFRGECASCHAIPTASKLGEPLFQAACAICHSSTNRASMVPDLLEPHEQRSVAYWEKWIAEGKAGSLMPAFAQKHGGPLSAAQVASLVEYAWITLPREPKKN